MQFGSDFILNKFLITFGEICINSYNKIVNFDLSKKGDNKIDKYIDEFREKEQEEQIFKQIILDKKDNENFIQKIRKKLIEKINFKLILLACGSIILISAIFGFEIGVILIVITIVLSFFIIYYPKIIASKKYDNLNLDLPYALRHLSTELKSGKGLYDGIITISNSNYGALSEEFQRVLEEIKYGKDNEQSLLDMASRVKSDGLTRAIQQIIGTLRVGGNLANSLSIIAEDINFDMQIKLKEYSQKLNGFILIYTFIAILAPVILLILLMASSTVMGDIVPGSLILILYVFFFPSIVVFLGLLIRKLEPKI